MPPLSRIPLKCNPLRNALRIDDIYAIGLKQIYAGLCIVKLHILHDAQTACVLALTGKLC